MSEMLATVYIHTHTHGNLINKKTRKLNINVQNVGVEYASIYCCNVCKYKIDEFLI